MSQVGQAALAANGRLLCVHVALSFFATTSPQPLKVNILKPESSALGVSPDSVFILFSNSFIEISFTYQTIHPCIYLFGCTGSSLLCAGFL